TSILRKGTASAHRQRQARILLLADTEDPDGAKSDSQIAAAVQSLIYDPTHCAISYHHHSGMGDFVDDRAIRKCWKYVRL
ncbi:MAG: hypothetical protein ABI318_06665, partial [Chthoniobacteraceae bacterium]